MGRSSSIAALLGLALALIPARAQTPAPIPPQTPTQNSAQSSAQQQIPAQQLLPAALPPDISAQPKSQPGAQGQTMAETQPAVAVPPGPVPPQEIKPAPPTPIAVKKVELGSENTWDPQWDVVIEENLPPELMSSEMAQSVKPFCPRFGELSQPDKRAFWAYLFQALAGAEAGLKPTADVKHLDPSVAVRDNVSHRTVRQQGLLQLTYEDSQRYGCDFDWEKDKHLRVGDPDKTILQPENNLLCGIRIMKNQLVDLNRPLLSSKSYWGTLRPGTMSYRVFAKQMANVPVACGAKTAPRHKSLDQGTREASATRPTGQSVPGGEE